MEPEVLVALQLGGPRTAVVLCGDVRQLGPACRSPLAVQRGLGVSILERLACHATSVGGQEGKLDDRGSGGYMQVLNQKHCTRTSPAFFRTKN